MKNRTRIWTRGGAALIMLAMLCFPGCGGKAQTPETTPDTTQKEISSAPVSFDLEKDVQFFGRTYEKSNIQWMNWSGSGFTIRFQGSAVAAEF